MSNYQNNKPLNQSFASQPVNLLSTTYDPTKTPKHLIQPQNPQQANPQQSVIQISTQQLFQRKRLV